MLCYCTNNKSVNGTKIILSIMKGTGMFFKKLGPRETGEVCPVRTIVSTIVAKWSSLILLALQEKPFRFSELKRELGDITQRVLTQNLKSLERDGLVKREVKPGPPVEVSYSLTQRGAEVVEKYMPLVIWAKENQDQISMSRDSYDGRA